MKTKQKIFLIIAGYCITVMAGALFGAGACAALGISQWIVMIAIAAMMASLAALAIMAASDD